MIKSFIRNVRKVKEREVQLAREGVVIEGGHTEAKESPVLYFSDARDILQVPKQLKK
jgi:hypothetical protein